MPGKILLICLLTFLYSSYAYTQPVDDNPNVFQTVVKPPPGYDFSGGDFPTDPITIDGFDNYFLGTDFGEPHIVTNPRNPLNSICAFNTNGVYYTLNGIDWVKVPVAFPGFSILGDPVLTFDSLGVATYAQLYQNGSTYGIVVTRSTNKGVSWSGAYNVASTTVGLSDKEWIAADQTAGPYSNNLYLGWRQFGASGMRFVRSTNGGVNWSLPMSFTGNQGAYVAVGPNGSIQGGSVYFAAFNNNNILVSRSTDGGVTFGSQVDATGSFTPAGNICAGRNTVKDCIRTNAFPKVAADNSYTSTRGNVYAVYEVNPVGADIADVYFVRSTNNGQTWSIPVKVNDDATTTDQWLPAISVDNKTGKIFISWYDSRVDPANNLLTRVYGTVSTNGGVSFTQNEAISNVSFNPNNMRQSQGSGQAFYIGDYFGIAAIGNTSYAVWMDGRNSTLGSFVGYYPDYAMTTASSVSIGNNTSTDVYVKVPAVKGPFNERIKFTASVDSMPSAGTISASFVNGKDSITSIPDSVALRITTAGSIPAGRYRVSVTGRGVNGTPVHRRKIDVFVNSSLIKVQTNRGTAVTYKVNGVNYNNPQEFVFANGSNVQIEAPPSVESGSNKYIFVNWSNGGQPTQTLNVSGHLTLTAEYRIQYKVVIISNPPSPNIFGNTFQDSAASFKFGVSYNRIIINQDSTYWFRGWNGSGPGSYTSSDSLGLDDTVTISVTNPIVEIIRWSLNNPSPVGITSIGSEIPSKFALYQNYPNPFNPETGIRFDVSKAGLVKVIVYDLLGRQVETLVNEVQQPGKYEIKYNAGHLASGIYYYRIEAADFVQVKKMLLIK